MKAKIEFEKVWFDEDIVELRILVSNGHSMFTNKVYVGSNELELLYKRLEAFKTAYYGGLEDITFGEFGVEYASGAFHARLHFPKPGLLYIWTKQQSKFFEFKGRHEASEANMYFSTEPALFDNFLLELKSLSTSSIGGKAELICT
ncbi:hypothetical protein CGG83_23245 [Vibrio parahaemolyticus]|uniref:hypothetical protein n=1 Tax=Vibrio parahaemolyticus TaxID=670 RepID=UPI00111CBC74|nr:hypothetical protein [Vibrio parahaemolyticus]TOR05401.1 hypothetical protein CGG83_23245 [Vibrio parahaemolyticus]TOR32799.1 hypothetical protein CGG76_24570 [Vibrio parahaemolyticus]